MSEFPNHTAPLTTASSVLSAIEDTHNPIVPQKQLWSLDTLIERCTSWQPKIAAQQRNSDLCVSEVIMQMKWRDRVYDLHLKKGRWVAIYIRVSTPAQRSGRSKHKTADGFSEPHQLRSCIEWCIVNNLAFRVYSDAGITSAYPPEDPALIRSLLKTKSDRYKKVYNRVWLSSAAKVRHTAEEIRSMEAYRDCRVAQIKAGPFRDKYDTLPAPGRRNSRVFHRQALTQAWHDIEAHQVHTVVVTDKSRIFRSADLEKVFYDLAFDESVKLIGTEEAISDLDVSEEDQKGAMYMLASVSEKQLTNSCSNSMKGFSELLFSGKPHSSLPFWLTRDADGNAIVVEENVPLVHQVIELYLDGFGLSVAISTKLRKEGKLLADGRELTGIMVQGVLDGHEVGGIQKHFGLDWPILPSVVSKETLDDLKEFREARERKAVDIAKVGGPKVRAHHLFRSLAFCTCGHAAQHHDDYDALEPIGYVLCHSRHRKDLSPTPVGHAYFPQSVLAGWLGGIMPHLGHLIRAVGPAEDTARHRTAAIADLEDQIRLAEADLIGQRSEALKNTERNAPSMGIYPALPSYRQIVDQIADALIAPDTERINKLRGQLTLLTEQATADRASIRLKSTLADVSKWLDLDTVEQNRVLRAIFDRIVISPSPLYGTKRNKVLAESGPADPRLEQGTITLFLQGVSEPLPSIKMFRGTRNGRGLRLDSPANWLRKMFGIEVCEDEEVMPERVPTCRINRGHLTPFLSFMRRSKNIDNDRVNRLAEAIRLHSGRTQKRMTVKQAVNDYLIVHGFSDELLDSLDDAWELYIASERERLMKVLRRSYSEEEAQSAWTNYLAREEIHLATA